MTIKDIARLAGVSCATVSRTLNGVGGVGEDTRQRILALCREHDYRTNQLARSLSASHTGVIGCIVSELNNSYFEEMAMYMERCISSRGYQLMLSSGRTENGHMEEMLDYLIGHRVDGIVIFGSTAKLAALVEHYHDRVPIVVQGCVSKLENAPFAAVSVDNELGGRLAATYLAEQGHRKVIVLGCREDNLSHAARSSSFCRTAEQMGMEVEIVWNSGDRSSVEVGYQLAKQFFFRNFDQTAIFAICDSVAIGALAAAKQFEIEVPRQLSVIGFDNICDSSLPGICLTTVDRHKKETIEQTVDYLIELIESDNTAKRATRIVTPELLVRKSVCVPFQD